MYSTIDWNNIPRYNINLRNCSNPSDICKIVKRYNTRFYIYRITYKGLVIKFGKSTELSRMYGERVYRQVGHSLSWQSPLKGKCGSDWYYIEEAFFNRYRFNMDKNDIVVTIWDFTKYPFLSINVDNEIQKYETNLIQSYVEVVGEKPIGNICDDRKSLKLLTVSKEAFSLHFSDEL